MTRQRCTSLAMATGLFCSVVGGFAQSTQTPVQQAQAGANASSMTYSDLERLYLDGKISAKQYQKLLNEIKSRPAPPPAAAARPTVPPQSVTAHPAPAPLQTNRVAAQAPKPPPQTNKDDKINEVEAKMDELIKAKAARDKAATNTPPRTATVGPKTKREKLNDLLRLYIEGKISETELNERRGKVLAEPD